MQINNGKYEHVRPVDSVEDAVWKSARDRSAYLSVDDLVLHRVQTDAIEKDIHLLHERPT
jgi:hypothetical protein